jgi:predicted enzyme related to lactoylglutathione lyase
MEVNAVAGRVVHFEIAADDSDRASAFYSGAFGWQVMAMPEMGYTIVTTGPSGEQGPTESGFINGGITRRQGSFASTNIVIDVDNIEDALRSITDAGGTVVEERMPIGEMGFAAYFTDTEGNFVGLWESAPSA